MSSFFEFSLFYSHPPRKSGNPVAAAGRAGPVPAETTDAKDPLPEKGAVFVRCAQFLAGSDGCACSHVAVILLTQAPALIPAALIMAINLFASWFYSVQGATGHVYARRFFSQKAVD
jgi:hypothetical protein